MKEFKLILCEIIANVSFILLILGFISFIYAAFLMNLVLGFVVLGVILVIMAYILQPPEQNGGNN
ncbi:hypothetical protein [Liquorilactobacillus hordei]|uniref:hypothetical protein n=1 Tax=Liquorilactobacillus hordei TaxID=468911 RepID=UPI0039ED1668